MNRSEIKDFNKFKQFFKEKYGSIALSMYTLGLNQQIPEDMEDIVRQINEEHDKAERLKTYQTLKQEFEPEKVIEPKLGDEVFIKRLNEFGNVVAIQSYNWKNEKYYKIKNHLNGYSLCKLDELKF